MNKNYDKVYAFTNENVSSYRNILPLNGADVLSIIGGGDQYFSCKLFGARKVEMYDINPESWYYFVLKFYGICVLSYEEFIELFIESSLTNASLLGKIFKILPNYVERHLIDFLMKNGTLQSMVMYPTLSKSMILNHSSGEIIPFFDRDTYYQLQSILRREPLPKAYIGSILDLPWKIEMGYDVVLTSNIFDWLNLNPKEYLEFLRMFKSSLVQAHYLWLHDDETISDFARQNCEITEIPAVSLQKNAKNFVITKKF